ncbi:MAG: hypothetical protein WAK90_09435 [Pseudolabrys sp.]|jgi:hypothetical protein
MNRLTILAPIALLLIACVTQPAEAYRVKRHATQSGGCAFTNEGRQVCGGSVTDRAAIPGAAGTRTRLASRAEAVDATGNGVVLATNEGTIIGSRPAGCPHSYCGCGLRMHLGLSDVRLNLASNWSRLFPHESAPRAGLAAVRSGHVMYIEAAAGNGQWVIRDYNSGRGLSRVHVRDVRGYAFVNPHATVAAR